MLTTLRGIKFSIKLVKKISKNLNFDKKFSIGMYIL